MDDETLKKFAYVNINTCRFKTMEVLKDDVETPTKITKKLKYFPITFQVLRKLKKHR